MIFFQGNLNKILSNKSGSREDDTTENFNVTHETSRSTSNEYKGTSNFAL